MNKMKYKTLREKIYYQLGYCAGYGEMDREILGYIRGELDVNDLPKYIEFEREKNKKMLIKFQKKLKIKTLNGSMADDELIVREEE